MAKFKHHRARSSNRMMTIWNVLLICYFIEIANNVALSIIAQSIEDNMGNKIQPSPLLSSRILSVLYLIYLYMCVCSCVAVSHACLYVYTLIARTPNQQVDGRMRASLHLCCVIVCIMLQLKYQFTSLRAPSLYSEQRALLRPALHLENVAFWLLHRQNSISNEFNFIHHEKGLLMDGIKEQICN